MFCIRCGSIIREGNQFCIRCGQRVTYTPPAPSPVGNILANGTTLQDRYCIIKRLGRGGMGVVYLASDNRFSNRVCVVKEMMEFLLNDYEKQKAVLRFNQEADLLASMNHPNIPQVYDRFSQDNRHYLVMEFVEGMDFKDLLKEYMDIYKSPLPEEDMMVFFMQLCSTLKYLHNHKPLILHRDIKPSNILLTCDGKAKLIDFGIAKAVQTNTQGTSVGTQGYAAPEQYKGAADTRTDIYALGATIHHLITGRDPQKETPFDYPPACEINDKVSRGLSDILGWMLQTDINKRPQDVESIIERLKNSCQDIDQKALNYSLENNKVIGIIRGRLKKGAEEKPVRIFCIYCGNEAREPNNFCIKCGRPLPSSASIRTPSGMSQARMEFIMTIPAGSSLAARYPGGFREYINVPAKDGSMRTNVILVNFFLEGSEYVYLTEKAPTISGQSVSVYSAVRNSQGAMQYIKPVSSRDILEKLYNHWLQLAGEA